MTFKLREGVTWHDGKPFTSADVAFSALNVWKPLQNLGRVVFKDLEAVDTPDATTAIFKFSKPTPFQLIRNALPALTSVVPKHVYEAPTSPTTRPTRAHRHRPVQIRRAQAGRILPAGEECGLLGQGPAQSRRDPLPRAAGSCGGGRRARGQRDPARRLLGGAARRPRPHLQGRGIKVFSKGYEALTYQLVVEINHRRKELADVKVRQAIAHAIDKDFVVKTIFLGYAKPATGPVPENDEQFYIADVPPTPSTWPRPTRSSTRPAMRAAPTAPASR